VRSFRAGLALRLGLGALLLFLALGLATVLALRSMLWRQLDATLLRIAETEGSAGAALTSSAFQFHEGVLTTGQAVGPELTRYAQLWSSDGTPLIRSQNLADDLVLPSSALAAARAGRIGWVTHTLPDGRRLRSVAYPLRMVGEAHGHHVLQVAAPTAPVETTIVKFTSLVGLLAVLLIVTAYFLGWRVADTALQPTREITAQAEELGAGSFPARITAHADISEFRRLVDVLNAMLARLDTAFRSQQRFTADASHELRGPLNVLRGEIEVALKRPRTEDEYREVLGRCRDEVLRLSRLASDLLLLARAEAGPGPEPSEELDLQELAASVVDRYRAPAAARGLKLELADGHRPIRGHGDLLERAIRNLVDNAIKYATAPGTVTLRVLGDQWPAIEVRDTGPGIPPEQARHLFDRFYRGDASRPRSDGSGLGLAIARAAAEAHGGTLEFMGNDPGAVFRLSLRGEPGRMS
jgi:two-component system, OmpR family, sensor kinase